MYFTRIRTISTFKQVKNAVYKPDDFQPGASSSQWNRVIKEAEKIVGYPTSFMNLRWLLSDEVSNMALHIRKLVGTNHPLVDTMKNLLYSKQNNLQPWGLVILLLSKSVKHNEELMQVTGIDSTDILQKQRVLAEVIEMLRTGHFIHKGLVNIIDKNINKETAAVGNKIGLLVGDYFLATAKLNLAKIRNQDLELLLASAQRDLAEGEFFGEQDSQNNPLPGKPSEADDASFEINVGIKPLSADNILGRARKEWTLRNMLGGATLLGRGCQGTMIISGQSKNIQSAAYLFGCNLNLAWQASNELQKITANDFESFSLVSAPVLFAIQDDQDIYTTLIQKARNGVQEIDFNDLKTKILKTGALKKTQILLEEHSKIAKAFVESLNKSKSTEALKNIIMNIC